jgi:hypothetical protein
MNHLPSFVGGVLHPALKPIEIPNMGFAAWLDARTVGEAILFFYVASMAHDFAG